MAAVRSRAGPSNGHGTSNNNKQAHLASAYQDLAKELASDKLKVVGGYTLGRVIGEGTYGSVHIATHRLTGTRCAVKKVPKGVTAQLTREIHHHRRLHHPHILHLHEILATESHVWLVSELCTGGELFDYLVERGRMLEGEARRLFGEMTVAVGFMHRQGVVHRDLKLENVLLDGELRVKLCDLGFVRENTEGRLLETFCGTTGYASPEMLAGRKYLGPETDVWSLGIILYTLLCGGLPFDDDNEAVMRNLISKGVYEEPEWLSDDAKSLIRGMLQLDPGQRLTIEKILKHRWFQHTFVDSYENVKSEVRSYPSSPNLGSQPIIEGQEGFFSDQWRQGLPSRSSPSVSPGLPGQSPLSFNVPTVAKQAGPESEASETSAPSVDSDRARKNSGDTTPTTVEEDEMISPTPMMRTHSGQESEVEKRLEMLHSNTSQSTIRKSGAQSPGTSSLASFRAKVAARSPLEGQAEVDEEAVTEASSRPGSAVPLSAIDESGDHDHEHTALLHVAQHSRTPSRTKRRSVSSQLSLERKHSHHSTSGTYQTYSPGNFLAELNADRPAPFSTPSEKHLLGQLVDLGFDTGQLMHSVKTDACDASAATWWILRQKQVERGETDEVIEAKQAAATRRRERTAAYAREERRKLREQSTSRDISPEGQASVAFKDQPIVSSLPVTPSVTVMDLGNPLPTTSKPMVASSEQAPTPVMNSAKEARTPEGTRLEKPLPPVMQESQSLPIPATPPRASRHGSPMTPGDDSPKRLKARTPSMNMLQRATSVWTGRKTDEKATPSEASPALSTDSKGRTSPSKLSKAAPTPMSKLPKAEPEISPMTVPLDAQPRKVDEQPEAGPSRIAQALDAERHSVSSTSSAGLSGSPGKSKGLKREVSLWQSFRNYFNEDKRRRKREHEITPSHTETKPVQTVVLSRGAHARVAHPNRTNHPVSIVGRRASQDVRRPGYSRHSSSATSRRSSLASVHHYPDTPDTAGPGYGRAVRRNDGMATPTSDRENPHSRPHSAQSARSFGHDSRRNSSNQFMRTSSLQSEGSARFRSVTTSPLHDYHRRPPSGTASSRIRHIRVIQEHASLPRTSSIQSNASSVRSAASSRRSSIDHGRGDTDRDQSDYDSARDDASIRARGRRSIDRRSGSSLVQQIHRSQSPFGQSKPRKAAPLRPKPLRDVFQQKKDEDWVSDEEDRGSGFAGGLGQNRSGLTPKNGASWASKHPSANQGTPQPSSKRATGRTQKGSSGRAGRSGKKTYEDEPDVSAQKGGTAVAEDGQARRRPQLPVARGLAPPTIQEDEENEDL